MRVIAEDEQKLIVYKPAGVLTQAARGFDVDLVSEVLTYRTRKKEAPYAAVINRLDRPVSGLVLFAKTKKEAARLSKCMQEQHFCKQYYALVCGKMEAASGRLVDNLIKDGKENISRIAQPGENLAKRAELEYEVIKTVKLDENRSVSLVNIHLLTGRHHQIRVQFATRGHAIVGDTRYGTAMECEIYEQFLEEYPVLKRKEIALCAYGLTVDDRNHAVDVPWLV